MRRNRSIAALVLAAVVLTAAPHARAQNGHFRQGVGAVNASMGGAGAASTVSLLGSSYLNPASLMSYGTRMEFSLDFQKPGHTLEAGGSTIESADDFETFPSVAITSSVGDRVSLGLGAFQAGGFRTRYAGVVRGAPLAVAAEYSAFRIAPAVAFAVSDAIWLGGSLLVDWTSFQQDPLIVGTPSAGWYPSSVGSDSETGVGFQAGLMWNINDLVSIGASYASKTGVGAYSLPATIADPASPSYGEAQQVAFQIETPAMLVAGLAMTPLPSLLLAADVRYLFYEDAAGFAEGDPTFDFDRALEGFGWRNVFAFSIGAEYAASDQVALRAGYNSGDSAVREELVSTNLTTPGIVENHLSFGLGWQPERRLRIDAGYVIGFENSVTGPFLGGSTAEEVTLKSSENSFRISFTLATRGL